MAENFDKQAAVAEIVRTTGLPAQVAHLAAHEDERVQQANVNALLDAGAGDPNLKNKAAVEQLRKDYHAARERRDVREMMKCKYRLGELGCYQV